MQPDMSYVGPFTGHPPAAVVPHFFGRTHPVALLCLGRLSPKRARISPVLPRTSTYASRGMVTLKPPANFQEDRVCHPVRSYQ